MTSRATSASARASSVWAWIRAASEAGAASSRPAVSMTRKHRSAIRPSLTRRSRVTPGISLTRASRRPTSRLNSVDFPTFGRPRMATAMLIGVLRRRLWSAIGRQSGVVGQHIEGIVGNHRRKIAAGRYLLATKGLAGIGRYRQRAAVRGEDDQPIATEHRARPGNRTLLFLLVLVARKHTHPSHLTFVPRQTHQLVVVRQNVNVVSGHPKAVSAAELQLPSPFAASEVDRRHPTAMAGGIHPATIDDRPTADVGESGDRIDSARRRKIVGPYRPSGFDRERVELTGRIGGHDDLAFDCRAGVPEQTGGFRDRVVNPKSPAIIRGKDGKLVLHGDDENTTIGHGGRAAHRGTNTTSPDHSSIRRIERQDLGVAGRCIETVVPE